MPDDTNPKPPRPSVGLTPKKPLCFDGPAIDPQHDDEVIEWIAQRIADRAIERMQTNG